MAWRDGTVVVFWRLRWRRGTPELITGDDDRWGPCSPWIDVPCRRASVRVDRGRARGFYVRYRLPAATTALIAEEEAEIKRLRAEEDAARERIRRMEQDFMRSLRQPRQFTVQDGSVWRFGRGSLTHTPADH